MGSSNICLVIDKSLFLTVHTVKITHHCSQRSSLTLSCHHIVALLLVPFAQGNISCSCPSYLQVTGGCWTEASEWRGGDKSTGKAKVKSIQIQQFDSLQKSADSTVPMNNTELYLGVVINSTSKQRNH